MTDRDPGASAASDMAVLVGVSRTYPAGDRTLSAVKDVSLRVAAGEWVALVGPSGSGKSTLLNLMAGLDRPSGGQVVVGGQDLSRLSEEGLARWRARNLGIVFQFFQLLPTLTARENVALPLEFAGHPRGGRARASDLLDHVGLGPLGDHLPGELSGGEQQRVAVARALVNDPPLIVADEPTGNLDAASGAAVLDLLVGYWRRGGTLIVVTHDESLARSAPRLLAMADGGLVRDERRPTSAGPRYRIAPGAPVPAEA